MMSMCRFAQCTFARSSAQWCLHLWISDDRELLRLRLTCPLCMDVPTAPVHHPHSSWPSRRRHHAGCEPKGVEGVPGVDVSCAVTGFGSTPVPAEVVDVVLSPECTEAAGQPFAPTQCVDAITVLAAETGCTQACFDEQLSGFDCALASRRHRRHQRRHRRQLHRRHRRQLQWPNQLRQAWPHLQQDRPAVTEQAAQQHVRPVPRCHCVPMRDFCGTCETVCHVPATQLTVILSTRV